MRQKILRETKEALSKALRGLEEICMTRRDDPQLCALKNDIRRTIQQPESGEDEKAPAA